MPHWHLVCFVAVVMVKAAAGASSSASLESFDKAVKAYLDLRKDAIQDVPALSKEASAEQIAAREKHLQQRIRAARSAAEPGDVIVQEARAELRRRLDAVLAHKPASKQKEIATGNPAHEGQRVTVKVNAPYPDDAPRSSVPTAVLAVLPPLPKQLEYRFYGDHLLLLDAEANLIVDFMTKAADPPPKEEQP